MAILDVAEDLDEFGLRELLVRHELVEIPAGHWSASVCTCNGH